MHKGPSKSPPVKLKSQLNKSSHPHLPSTTQNQPGRISPGIQSSYSTLYFTKYQTSKPSVIDKCEETVLLKDLWSDKGGNILSKIEQVSVTGPAKASPRPNDSLCNASASLNATLNRFQKGSYCKNCSHCQANSLGMHKVKQLLKPLYQQIPVSPDIDISSYILNTQKVKDYYTREGIEGEDSKCLDVALEMLLSRKLELSKVVDNETLKRIKDVSLFNAMSFFKRKDIDNVLMQVKKIMDKAGYVRETIKKTQPAGSNASPTGTSTIISEIKKKIQAKSPIEDELYPTVIFTCIQELVREFTLTSKDRGTLLLRAFSQFFEENENRWLRLIEIFIDTITCLELELQSLMRAMPLKGADIDLALNMEELGEETLAAHKKLIRDLLANLQQERSKRISLEKEIEILKRQLNLWIIDWEKLKISKRITDRLATLTEPVMQETFHLSKELEEDQRALTLNIERLMLALPGKFRFEEEREQYKAKLEEKEREIARLKRLIEALKEESKGLEDEKTQLEEQAKLHAEFTEKAFKQLKFREFREGETQTDPEELLQQKDLSQGGLQEEFMKVLVEVKEVQPIKEPPPLSVEDLLKQLKFFYTKLSKYRQTEEPIPISPHFTMFHTFARHLWDRYEIKEVALKKCKEILVSTAAFQYTDPRIEAFSSFLGINEKKAIPEAPFIYINLLKASQVPFETIFGKDWNSPLEFEAAYKSMKAVVQNTTKESRQMMKKGIFSRGKISFNAGLYEIITTKNSTAYYIMYKLNRGAKKRKVASLVGDLAERFTGSTQESIRAALVQVITRVAKVQKETEAIEFLEEHCKENGKISFEKVMRILKSNIEVTIDFDSYLKVGLKVISQYLDHVKSLACSFTKKYGKAQSHYLSQEEVNTLLQNQITDPKENWRIVAFMEASFSNSRTQGIAENQFATFLLNKPLLHKLLEPS